jgi:hypothetical protein
MRKAILPALALSVVIGSACFTKIYAQVSPRNAPETVLATYRAKPGMENDLRKFLAVDWTLLRKHGLVLSQPHIVLRGEEEPGRTYFVEVMSWKDHEAADHVPPDVQEVWTKMGAVTEARGGHRAIEFPEVHVVETGE